MNTRLKYPLLFLLKIIRVSVIGRKREKSLEFGEDGFAVANWLPNYDKKREFICIASEERKRLGSVLSDSTETKKKLQKLLYQRA